MLTCTQITRDETIQHLRDTYLHTLSAPLDGMWESAVISRATFWEIQDQGRHIGHFCLDTNHTLLRFSLLENKQERAQSILRWIISTCSIEHAIASTIETAYFSLCADLQSSSTIYSYLFHDHTHVELPPLARDNVLRKAEMGDFDELMHFYQENTEGPGEWIEPFLRERISRSEAFVWHKQRVLVASGECIPSQKQAPYADLGMVVAQTQRGRGLGSSMLIQLKHHCYKAGWQPICSCTADNLASKNAIEKAGFLSTERMLKITFAKSA